MPPPFPQLASHPTILFFLPKTQRSRADYIKNEHIRPPYQWFRAVNTQYLPARQCPELYFPTAHNYPNDAYQYTWKYMHIEKIVTVNQHSAKKIQSLRYPSTFKKKIIILTYLHNTSLRTIRNQASTTYNTFQNFRKLQISSRQKYINNFLRLEIQASSKL